MLLELGASKKLLTLSKTEESIVAGVEKELARMFGDVALVPLSQTPADIPTSSTKELYILQRWSMKWETFVDVKEATEVEDGDRLTAVSFSPLPASTAAKNVRKVLTPMFKS